MQVVSEVLEFENTGDFSTEKIESLINRDNCSLLRWAIVEVNDKNFRVSVTYQLIV